MYSRFYFQGEPQSLYSNNTKHLAKWPSGCLREETLHLQRKSHTHTRARGQPLTSS